MRTRYHHHFDRLNYALFAVVVLGAVVWAFAVVGAISLWKRYIN